MKFSAALFAFGLISCVAAIPQASSQTTTSAVPAPTPSSSYSSEKQACLAGCQESDVKCRAKCLGAPAPSDQQANDTTKCVAQCDKGDGSPDATKKYSSCVDTCINEHYLPTGTSSQGTGSTGTVSAPSSTGTGSGTGSKTNNGNSTSTSTSNSSTPQKTGSASGLMAATSFAAVMAMLVAAIAL